MLVRIVVGVDPAESTGVAIMRFDGPRASLLRASVMTDPRGGDMLEVLVRAEDIARSLEARCVLAVEDQWIPWPDGDAKKQHSKASSALSVASRRGGWIHMAETRGFAVMELHPSKWRRSQLGKSRLGSRAQAKRLAVTVATALWPTMAILGSHDAAEAALIAKHAGVTLAMEDTWHGHE